MLSGIIVSGNALFVSDGGAFSYDPKEEGRVAPGLKCSRHKM
jgi:hypothetical protein